MTSTLRQLPGIGDAVVRLAVIGLCLLLAPATAPASVLEIGTLTCEPALGPANSIICDFHVEDGPSEAYAGIIDEPSTSEEVSGGQTLKWSVVTSLKQVQSGDLAGEYVARGKAVLVGGHARSFTLRALREEGMASEASPRVQKLTLIASN